MYNNSEIEQNIYIDGFKDGYRQAKLETNQK